MNTNKQVMKKKTKHKWTSTLRNLEKHKIKSKRKRKQEHYCDVNTKHFNHARAGARVRSGEHKVMDRSFYYNENDRDISRFSWLRKLWTMDTTRMLRSVWWVR